MPKASWDQLKAAEAEIERLRAALRQIIAEADSDDGMTAWDGSEIARKALGPRPDGKAIISKRRDK